MRYILDDNGYIDSVSCTPFNCKDKGCTEYTGEIPEDYETLQEWACNANIRAYKIVSNNLVYDAAKAAELEAEWERAASGIVTGVEVATNEYVDGKQVYCKRIDVGYLPNSTAKTVSLNFSCANIELIRIAGGANNKKNGGNVHLPIPHTIAGELIGVALYDINNTGRLEIKCQNDRSSYYGYVNLYYTKAV